MTRPNKPSFSAFQADVGLSENADAVLYRHWAGVTRRVVAPRKNRSTKTRSFEIVSADASAVPPPAKSAIIGVLVRGLLVGLIGPWVGVNGPFLFSCSGVLQLIFDNVIAARN